jgi:nicotinamidase-related amidase
MNRDTGLCSVENSLLLVIDQQSKLIAAMQPTAAEFMLEHSKKLLKAAGILNVPVLVTEQYPKGLGPTKPALSSQFPKHSTIFDKTGFSCCAANGFNDAVANTHRKQIVLVGQETHVCVLQTALELTRRGYQVFVVEDACCSRKAAHKSNALARMQQQGIIITNYESVLFEWLRDASHPSFKIISGLVK